MDYIDKTDLVNARIKVFYESLFTVIPIICLLMISIYKGNLSEILSSYEWSLIACILFGQLIAKFVALSSTVKPPANQVTLVVTLIICLGLIPSAIILVLSLIQEGEYTTFLVVAQFFMFCLSMLCYIFLGTNCDKFTGESKELSEYGAQDDSYS